MIDKTLMEKMLDAPLIIHGFVNDEPKCNYERYMTELLNCSALFMNKTGGEKFCWNEKQDHGECDATTSSYSIDYKLLATKSSLQANLFEQLCKFVISNRFVINDNDFLRKHGMPYDFILRLDESGLLNSSGNISFHKEISKEPELILDFGDYILMAISEENRKFTLKEFPLMAAGRELSMIVGSKMDLELIKEICQVAVKNNSKINLSLHKVNYREEDSINYDNNPIVFMNTPDTETTV